MKTLIDDFPEIVKEWHPTKNGEITPDMITFASAKKVWFQCEKGHEWNARVFSRTKNGSGCPVCHGKKADKTTNLRVLYPLIAAEWHPTKNKGITPEEVVIGSAKIYWWQCKKGHEWKTMVCHRTKNGTGCPYCCNQKINIENCVATTHPHLVLQWHPDNKLTPFEVGLGGHRVIKWQCSKAADHVWEVSLGGRAKNTDCPCCAGRKAVASNCLSTTHPQIALEWHPTKNGRLTPEMVVGKSNKYAWFQCQINKDHVWRTLIETRTKGCGCPICSSSKGEKKIEAILKEINIEYKREYKLADCKYKRPLAFDFAVFKDGKLQKLIEFQGRHHYEIIAYFGGEKAHKDVLTRDNIKKTYCEANQLPFLVIPHWELEKIDELVFEFIND